MGSKRFVVKIADNEEELQKTYALRYSDLVLEYDKNAIDVEGFGFDNYDRFAKQLIIIDTVTNDVVGCYRLVLSDDLDKDTKFVCENEFKIDNLKAIGAKICELSRAVIKKEYRNGLLLPLLWKFIYDYAHENNIRFMIGDASINTINREDFRKEISYYVQKYPLDPALNVKSLDGLEPMELIPLEEINEDEIKQTIPPLIKAYAMFGSKFALDSYTDLAFRSVDLFVVIDFEDCNEEAFKKIFRLVR